MNVQDIVALIAVYLIIAAALGLSLYVQKRGINWDNRKIIHIGVGAFIYVWWAFSANWIMLAFFSVPFAIILFFAMFPGNPISNSKLGEVTNDMGHRYGLFLYVVTINILVAFFFDDGCIGGEHWLASSIAIVAMTRGDGYGSIVGKRFGKHKIINGKSLEGTFAVFAATFVFSMVVIVFYGFLASQGLFLGRTVDAIPALAFAAVAGVIAAVVEAVCPGDIDNLLIPMTVLAAMILMGL